MRRYFYIYILYLYIYIFISVHHFIDEPTGHSEKCVYVVLQPFVEISSKLAWKSSVQRFLVIYLTNPHLINSLFGSEMLIMLIFCGRSLTESRTYYVRRTSLDSEDRKWL